MLMLFALPASSILPFVLEGKSVQARVTQAPERRGEDRGRKFGPKFTIQYEYADDKGTVYSGVGRVRTADACQVGDLIPVRYLSSMPAQSRLEENLWGFLPTVGFTLLGMLAVVAAVWRGALGIRSVNRQVWG